MKGKKYGKPVMIVDFFGAQDFISACWYLLSDDIKKELYHDTKTSYVLWEGGNVFGYYNSGEQVVDLSSVPDRIPNNGYLKTDHISAITDSYKWYESMYLPLGYVHYRYEKEVTPLYLITYNSKQYYYSNYQSGGNHS